MRAGIGAGAGVARDRAGAVRGDAHGRDRAAAKAGRPLGHASEGRAREREGNKTAEEAIYEGSLIRFRPIMMTTMAALMGTLPIAFGSGAGADSRRPLGLAVVGGLLFSQLVTLYLTPVFYTYMDRFQSWTAHRFGKAPESGKPSLAGGPASAD